MKANIQLGSPPRMRGKVQNELILRRDARITPAYAGKRDHPAFGELDDEDHPRVCGEK